MKLYVRMLPLIRNFEPPPCDLIVETIASCCGEGRHMHVTCENCMLWGGGDMGLVETVIEEYVVNMGHVRLAVQ